jgi:hypothetical protein
MVKKCIRKDIEIEKTTHGYKVTSNYGDKEVDFFNKKREAEKFVKSEFSVKCKK